MSDGKLIRHLLPEDAASLQSFRCHQQNRWTKDVQRTVQVDVVDLVTGRLGEGVDAVPLGWFESDTLLAVAVYSATEHFEVLSLAVGTQAQGKGIGLRFKQYLIGQARDLGFEQVFSRVHRANHPMLSINYRLGAWLEAEDDDRNFHICVVNVE